MKRTWKKEETRGYFQDSQVPTCHVMVSMALTNQRRLHKGWNTPYAPYGEWNAFPARLKEGRKVFLPSFKRAGERIRNASLPAFFFKDGDVDKAFVRPAVQWWVKGRPSLQRKRGLRPWTRLPWPCSIRKEHRPPLVERRRSGRASQRSRRREAHLNATSKNWQGDGPSWARSRLMSDVELRSSRSNFATGKVFEAFKLHQKSKRARSSEKERKKERERSYWKKLVCIRLNE